MWGKQTDSFPSHYSCLPFPEAERMLVLEVCFSAQKACRVQDRHGRSEDWWLLIKVGRLGSPSRSIVLFWIVHFRQRHEVTELRSSEMKLCGSPGLLSRHSESWDRRITMSSMPAWTAEQDSVSKWNKIETLNQTKKTEREAKTVLHANTTQDYTLLSAMVLLHCLLPKLVFLIHETQWNEYWLKMVSERLGGKGVTVAQGIPERVGHHKRRIIFPVFPLLWMMSSWAWTTFSKGYSEPITGFTQPFSIPVWTMPANCWSSS